MAAASVGLSMALISIAKFLLFICGATALLWAHRTGGAGQRLARSLTPKVIMLILCVFAISLVWTDAPDVDALGSLAKYGKLLVIALLLALIRSKREALYALAAFALAQSFLLLSSWLLFAGVALPWATSNMAQNYSAVFSSYLDQGIISAVFAAICWHFRGFMPGRFGPRLAVFVAFMALFNVLFVLMGRSGHLVAIALVSLAIMWELPKRYRAVVLLLPFVLALGLFASSDKVRERLTLVETEMQAYSPQTAAVTSTGLRLTFWRSAAHMIAERPLAGFGVGSWSTEYNALRHSQNPAHVNIDGNGNPHQEYLLWGVQLGVPGILLLLALMGAILRDSLKMPPAAAKATQSTLAALAVACLFNASLYDALIGDFFCVLLGLLLALGLSESEATASHAPAAAIST